MLGESEIAKSGPKPVRVTDCGLLTPLSVKFIVAVSSPYTLGVITTDIVQLTCGESNAGQALSPLGTEKSAALGPVKLTTGVVRSAPPAPVKANGIAFPATPIGHWPMLSEVDPSVTSGASGTYRMRLFPPSAT